MDGPTEPRVSIGLAVYNGERYIAESIESILGQTFVDFELIIIDNASTDRTEEICRDFESRDPRIRYIRNAENLGASPSHNRCVELAVGEYFQWASHDDVIHPDCLKECVEALDSDPSALLCHSLIELIDEKGETLDVHDTFLTGSDSPRPSVRFASLALRPHACLQTYSLMRTRLLRRTRLLGSYHGSDRALLCELALVGRFIRLPKPLYKNREHPGRYRRSAKTARERRAFYDTRQTGRLSLPTADLYGEYVRMVPRHVEDRRERLRCYASLARWWFVNWNLARLVVDIAAVVSPGIVIRAERLKQRFFSPEPGSARPVQKRARKAD
jgi:glycosyltransferase involved in cell wall biosynthesis